MPYTPPSPDLPNPDSAGGKLILALTGGPGPDTHHIGVHIQAVASAPSVLGDSVDWHYPGGSSGLPGIVWTGTEGTVGETFNSLGTLLMAGYDDTWTLSVAALYTKDAGSGRLLQVFPAPNPAALPGSSSSLHVNSDATRVSASIYLATSWGGGRFRLVLPCFAARQPQPRVVGITGAAPPPGDAHDEALVNYLKGGDTRIIAHNGGQPTAPFKRYVTAMAKYRRIYSAPNLG